MTLRRLNENALTEKLNNLVQLSKAYHLFFFNWGFYYWNAGILTFKYKSGNCF